MYRGWERKTVFELQSSSLNSVMCKYPRERYVSILHYLPPLQIKYSDSIIPNTIGHDIYMYNVNRSEIIFKLTLTRLLLCVCFFFNFFFFLSFYFFLSKINTKSVSYLNAIFGLWRLPVYDDYLSIYLSMTKQSLYSSYLR